MPKGIKKERGPLDAPRAIPVSQSVLYRTIKKAFPFGVRLDGTAVEDGELGVSYSHRQILDMVKANIDKHCTDAGVPIGTRWTFKSVSPCFVWDNSPEGDAFWRAVNRVLNKYVANNFKTTKKGSE